MSRPIFEKAKDYSLAASGGTDNTSANIAVGDELIINTILLSADKQDIVFEFLYSEDGGTTWINPWQTGGTFIRKIYFGKNSPVYITNLSLNFPGGTNHKVQFKVTNNASSTANVSITIRGYRLNI